VKKIEVSRRGKELDLPLSREGGIIRGKIFCFIGSNALECE
jgi:hypothetical protein